jgi:hypothetical protein
VPACELRHPAGERSDLRPIEAVETRFLSRRMLAALGGYVLFAANFSAYRVFGDGTYYFDTMRGVFGEHVPAALAYQFGCDVWNAPFYLCARVLQALSGRRELFGFSLVEISITVASNAAVGVMVYVGWRLLRRLDLPAGPAVLLLTVFGTPLFYYATFQPSYAHAADALGMTLLAAVLLHLLEDAPRRGAVLALGALLGYLAVVRYADVALWPGILGGLAWQRRSRDAAIALGAALVTFGLIFALPALRGVRYGVPHTSPPAVVTLDVFAPLKLLFSLHRGLFTWTPLCLIAAVGMGLLIANDRRRPYFLSLAAAAVSLICAHALWGNWWDGGWSFSARYLTNLFPLYLIGFAAVARRWPRAAYAFGGLAAAWALYIGLNHVFGVPQTFGVADIAHARGPRAFFHLLVAYSRFHHL